MLKLSTIVPEDINGGINLVDLGASGGVPPYWKSLAYLTNLIGFDPNDDECSRLSAENSGFLSQRFLPHAIAGESRTYRLYKTRSIYCWSLLEPNLPWLRRFAFSDLFEVEGTEELSALTLTDVEELKGLDIDAIKLDTQGLELPILEASKHLLQRCILVETETGFSDNYIGETTFDQIARHMRSMGFELFDINPHHRVSRKNRFADTSDNEQVLWCEAIWLRDYWSQQPDAGNVNDITREKALKALCIFANHGCLAFGLEAAKRFEELGLLSADEYHALSRDKFAWELRSKSAALSNIDLLRNLLNLVPRRYFEPILTDLTDLHRKPHPLSFLSR